MAAHRSGDERRARCSLSNLRRVRDLDFVAEVVIIVFELLNICGLTQLIFSLYLAGLPILPPSNRMTGEDLVAVGTESDLHLGNFGFNLDNLDFFGPPHPIPAPTAAQHLLPPHLPRGPHDCFPALQPFTDPWATAQTPTQPDVQANAPELSVPVQPFITSFVPIEPFQYLGAPLDRRRRLGVTPQPRNRSRSTNINLDFQQFLQSTSEHTAFDLADLMSQLSGIDARLRVLSVGLLARERGQETPASPNGTSTEFTVAEMYRQTHCFVVYVEQTSAQQGASEASLERADPANNMFTLSTYVRLLDMFQRLFNLVKRQLAKADPGKDDTFARWQLPEMSIGAASINAHPAFHMSLTVQLAIQLLNRLRNGTASLAITSKTNGTATNGSTNGESEDSSPFAEVVHVSFNAIRSKEEILNKSLTDLKAELDTFMDTMDAIDASVDVTAGEK